MFLYMIQKRIINGNAYTQPTTELSPCILFGDQLTSVPVQGAPALCCFHKTSLDCLEGYTPDTSVGMQGFDL